MSVEQRDFIETITNFNIEARYPEDKDAVYRLAARQAVNDGQPFTASLALSH